VSTPPRLRLVDPSRPWRADAGDAVQDGESPPGSDFDAVDRPAHDLHLPYREPGPVVQVVDTDIDGDTEPAPASPPGTPPARFVVVALIAFQLLAALSLAGKYIELARGGDVYALAALLSAPSSLCLYAGAVLLALRPGRGRALFVVAAVGLGLSLPAWGVAYGWTWPMALGAILGLAGAWYARAEVRPDADAEAQP